MLMTMNQVMKHLAIGALLLQGVTAAQNGNDTRLPTMKALKKEILQSQNILRQRLPEKGVAYPVSPHLKRCSSAVSCQSYKTAGGSIFSEVTVTLADLINNDTEVTKADKAKRALLVTMTEQGTTSDGFRQGAVGDGVRMLEFLQNQGYTVLWLRDFEPDEMYVKEEGNFITTVSADQKDEMGVTTVYVVAREGNERKQTNKPNEFGKEAFDNALKWLTEGSKNGNRFFYYSGHGGEEETCCLWWKKNKYSLASIDVSDEYLHKNLVKKLDPSARLTMMFDSCHSGGMGAYLANVRDPASKSDKVGANVLTIAACEAEDTTRGSLTLRFLEVMGLDEDSHSYDPKVPSSVSILDCQETITEHKDYGNTVVIKSSYALNPEATRCDAFFGGQRVLDGATRTEDKVEPTSPSASVSSRSRVSVRRRLINRLDGEENH